MRRGASEGLQGARSRTARSRGELRVPGCTALRSLLLLASAPLGPALPLAAQDAPLNSAALFLLFPVGAEAVGMGQTGIAMAGRSDAAFWNPAGLAGLESGEFSLHSATLAAGRTHVVTAYFPSSSVGVIGGALYLVDYGELESTDSIGNPIGRLAPRNLEFLASYATTVAGGVTLGINYKLIEFRAACSGDCRNVPDAQGVTHALDVGGQFALGPARALRVGVAVRHLGFPLQVQNKEQADPLPVRFAVGARYRVAFRPLTGVASAEPFDLRVAADVDSPWRGTGDSEMRVGFDVGYGQLVRVRGGYAFTDDGLSGPSVGVGVASGAIGVDLARSFLTDTDLVVPNPTFFSFRVTF